ncbi:calcium-binding protein [Streptomyces sp. NPDC056728]
MPTPITGLRRTLGRTGAAAATGLALVLTAPGAALAAPGDLDPGFDGDGKVVTDFGGYDESRDMALQADGKIVTVGLNNPPQGGAADFTLARYNTNGSLDTSFDGDGLVLTDVSGGDEDIANGVAVQPDGKIVVVGRSVDPVSGGNRFTVVRYNSNGSLDTGFDGDGIALTDFGTGVQEAYAVTVQANGAIVAVGESGPNVALARYNTDGSLDTSFDGDGRVTTPFATADVAGGLKVQPDGKLVVSGTSDFDFALARYNPDGTLDSGFDGDGKVTTSFGAGTLDGSSDLALQPDGKIVAAGISQADFAVARYNVDGSLDSGFGTGGKVTTDVYLGFFDSASAVALQSDGKIVVSGNTGDDRGLVRYQVAATPPPTGVDLSVTKAGPATVSLGDQATYTVTVTNKSTTTAATGITLADALTGPGTVLSATPGQGTCTITSAGANCALGSLASGASTTVTVVAEPRATGTLSDKATVTATQTDPVPANNSATATSTVNNAHGCTITGTSGADTLTGGYGNDVICALSGNDTVRAGFGSDTVYGGPGNDNIDGGFDNDTLIGGPGNDTLTGYFGNDRLNTVDNVSGNDTANGGMGTDTCTTDPGDGRVSCP